MRYSTAVTVVLLCSASVCGRAQWLNYPARGTPRTRDGKPNLAAPAPRTSYGKPDLSGIWQAEGAPIEELVKLLPGGANGLGEATPSKYFLNILSDFQAEQALYAPRLPPCSSSACRPLEKTRRELTVSRPECRWLPCSRLRTNSSKCPK